MNKEFAVAIVLGQPGDYSAIFPDFPGAGAGGDTINEALARAADNLAAHIEGRIEAGLDMPPLRPIDAIAKDKIFIREIGGVKNAKTFGLVPVEMPGKSVRINISIDDGLLASVDQAAGRAGESRSGFLAAAARARIAALRKAG